MLNGTAMALLAGLMVTHPAAADTAKWGAHLDFEGRWGNSRALGDAGLFAPLWQNQTALLFTDIRGRFDSQDGREGNFGLGYRQMLSNGWNLGVYGYYDVRRTSLGNMFNQATVGIEALSADWDLRANVYAPFGNRSRQIGVLGGGNPFADFAGGTIQIVTPGLYQRVERALTGFDGEIGWRAPVFDVDALTQVRLYGGGFYFDGGGVTRDITGPRSRIEFSLDGVAGFSSAQLTLGAEVQHDDVRGTQGFAIARLRVPLHAEKSAPRLSAQERRMTERVVRDVDIVSGTGRGAQLKAEIREAAINTWNNQTVTDVVQVSAADSTALQVKLNALGAGSVVILNGAPTVLGTTAVGASQTLLGGGTVLALKGATTGAAVNFLAPGVAGNLTGARNGTAVVALGAGSVLGGLTVGNTYTGFASDAIQAVSAPGAVAFGNTVATAGSSAFGVVFSSSANGTASGNKIATEGSSAFGVYFYNSASGVVSGNTIATEESSAVGVYFYNSADGVASGNTIATKGSIAYGLAASGSNSLTVSGNTFDVTHGNTIYGWNSSFVSAASTGNIDPRPDAAANRCGSLGGVTGTVSFIDGINCVYP